MRLYIPVFLISLMFAAPAFAACRGDLSGQIGKRPVDSSEKFYIYAKFKVDTKTGAVSICDNDRKWDGKFSASGKKISFIYNRRMNELTRDADGIFVSEIWQGEFQGVVSEYQIWVISE